MTPPSGTPASAAVSTPPAKTPPENYEAKEDIKVGALDRGPPTTDALPYVERRTGRRIIAQEDADMRDRRMESLRGGNNCRF